MPQINEVTYFYITIAHFIYLYKLVNKKWAVVMHQQMMLLSLRTKEIVNSFQIGTHHIILSFKILIRPTQHQLHSIVTS
jgi:hypothetical protein